MSAAPAVPQVRDALYAALAKLGGDGVLDGSAVGVDVVDSFALARQLQMGGARLRARLFTKTELAYCEGDHDRLATTVAGKEAVSKVLGTGFRQGVRWTDIEIAREPTGGPYVQLRGRAADVARQRRFARIAISLSHEAMAAVGVAVGLAARDAA